MEARGSLGGGLRRVEFIDENGGGPAVRLRKRAHVEKGGQEPEMLRHSGGVQRGDPQDSFIPTLTNGRLGPKCTYMSYIGDDHEDR